MEKRKLGNIEVTEIGIGQWPFPMDMGKSQMKNTVSKP